MPLSDARSPFPAGADASGKDGHGHGPCHRLRGISSARKWTSPPTASAIRARSTPSCPPPPWSSWPCRRGEGFLTDAGALAACTGAITGRSPKDRYLVAGTARPDEIWWGPVNRPMEPAVFDRLFDRVRAYLQGRDLFVCDASACADPRHALPVRVIADGLAHALRAVLCCARPSRPGRRS